MRVRTSGFVAVGGLALVLLTSLLLSACGSSTAEGASSQDGVAAQIPGGWKAIGKPITAVTYPQQVLAAASFPVHPPVSSKSCTPTRLLKQMPKDGAFVQVVEYTRTAAGGKHVAVPHLPPKPKHLTYEDGTFARFECAGPSYRFEFSLQGRSFQAQIWLNRAAVDPETRRDALRLLNSFHLLGNG